MKSAMTLSAWEHFFKPEVRSSGRSLSTKAKLTQSRPSDTEVQTYIHGSGNVKVILKSESVSDQSVLADCSCPQFKKGQFCKHIWAALLTCAEKNADFLEEKRDLEINDRPKAGVEKKTTSSQKREEFNTALKEKQADYRKQQYQKQKQRLSEQKKMKSGRVDVAEYPEQVEKALDYFLKNGFPLRETMSKESIALAKKKLSRVFHPDAGGHHDEIIELNDFAETLMKFVLR